MPSAVLCVPCLNMAGDVPTLKRFDEFLPDGVVMETYFTHDPRIERQMKRMNVRVADSAAFAVAVGDDSHLTPEINQVVAVARPLHTAFEEVGKESPRTRMASVKRILRFKGLPYLEDRIAAVVVA